MARAVYRKGFQLAIAQGKAREIPGYGLIEVLASIQAPVRWKEKRPVTKDGKVVGFVWHECMGLVEHKPGEVLHPEWRPASEWEKEEWHGLSEEELEKLGVVRKDGKLFIQIIEKIVDLPAAIRQRGRHIPGEEITRMREKFVLTGDAQLLAGFAEKLSKLLQDFLKSQKPSPQLMDRASRELIQISQTLERSRTSLKKRAQAEVQLALQGKFWEMSARVAGATSALLEQRVKDYETAIKSLKLAENWCDLMKLIEKRFYDAYNRLGELGEELQSLISSGKEIQPEELLKIAKEAYGIWMYLSKKVPTFDPYYRRLQAYEFQRLSKAKEHAEKGKAETVLNDIKEATAKLEAVAIGEKVTRAELAKERELLF